MMKLSKKGVINSRMVMFLYFDRRFNCREGFIYENFFKGFL